MSENRVRPIWTPADYAQTVADAAKHRTEAAAPAEVDEAPLPHRPLLPYRRDPDTECDLCFGPAGYPCEQFCLARLSAAEQMAHRDAVIDRTLDELDERMRDLAGQAIAPWAKRSDPDFADADEYRLVSCTVTGRHRARPDYARRVRRLRALIATAVLVLVLALGALWASQRAHAETFDNCPSGLTGVSTPDTSCAFADSVRAAFYHQIGWTVFAYSPVTGKFYTMQCGHAVTDNGWWAPKRCYGINETGAALVVYIA